MTNPTGEQISKKSADVLSKSAQAVEKVVKDSSSTLTESGKGAAEALKELTKAYQELAAKNVKNLTTVMEELVAVKSPAEFMELQQRLIKEGVEAAAGDSRRIAELTTAVFTAALEPVKKQFEAAQKASRT
ncbi:TIGR01841 family phasin [Rhodoblastus sp.]|uniref:TIGR01841 family phasin n=1 Tax=Rhodoblastus sp. TaxID=1962975 RepID=UPI003FD85219